MVDYVAYLPFIILALVLCAYGLGWIIWHIVAALRASRQRTRDIVAVYNRRQVVEARELDIGFEVRIERFKTPERISIIPMPPLEMRGRGDREIEEPFEWVVDKERSSG
jgi:hypothetical protein